MRKRVALGLVTGLILVSAHRLAHACAGCSNPNLPTARSESQALEPFKLSIALNLTGTTMRVTHSEHCPDIGPICQVRDEPPQIHDQRFYVGELRPIVAFGLMEGLALEAQLPLRLVKTTVVFRRLDGTPFEPDYRNIHHRNETLYGFADPWLLGRVTVPLGGLSLTARAGLGLPVGSTEENPFARGRAGLEHQHIQFGTGTFYPVFALDASTEVGAFRLSAYAQTLLFLYENGHGYQAGNRYMGGLAAETDVTKGFRVGLGTDLLNEQPERWDGVVQQDGNVGRTDWLVGGSASHVFGETTVSLSVKVPVYQQFVEVETHHDDADPGQLTYPAIVNLGVERRF